MIAFVSDSFQHLVDDHLARRISWIAHAEVDDVNASAPFSILEVIDLAEQIWWQAANAIRNWNREIMLLI